MPRIEISTATTTPWRLGRPLMSDHNFSGRLWATAALIAVPFAARTGLGWWLPLHIALLGAVTQAIVGGQLMFSATLGLSRGPSRSVTLIQLGLLNVAAILVIMGRLVGEPGVLAAGVSIFVPVIAWVTWQVHTMWSASVNRRFSITGTFYRLAGVSLLFGSSIGGALGIGAFNEPASYLAPRGIHSILNVFGWAGMTIVGTAITIVPTVLHVRSPSLKVMRPVPWLMAGGLLVMATGSDDEPGMAGGIGHGDLPVWACGFRLIPQDRPIDPQRSQSPDGRVVSRRGHGLGRNHRNSPRHRNDARRQRCDARPGRRRWRRRICIPSAPWSVVVPPPST